LQRLLKIFYQWKQGHALPLLLLCFNPKYALENLLRVKSTSNQRFLKFEKCSAAMIFKFKELIYCIFNSHNEVLTHNLGLINYFFSGGVTGVSSLAALRPWRWLKRKS